jgi:hypothetical protein
MTSGGGQPISFQGWGGKSVTCLRSPENSKSSHQSPGELPAMLFNSNWLKDVDDDYRQITLNISKDNFPWMEFMPEQQNEADIV